MEHVSATIRVPYRGRGASTSTLSYADAFAVLKGEAMAHLSNIDGAPMEGKLPAGRLADTPFKVVAPY